MSSDPQRFSQIKEALATQKYVAQDDLVMTVWLSEILQKPILLEGPAGVGKTEVAKALSGIHQSPLIRLQCYEGLDASQAIYEWDYQRQLLTLKMINSNNLTVKEKEDTLFSKKYLIERPLLQALRSKEKSVLLIDEIDRADEEFESYLLEILSDWQVSIPEIGTLTAKSIPWVIITSNRTRDLSDALRRRCLYLWIDYPDIDQERKIIQTKLPHIHKTLSDEICRFMAEIRKRRLEKTPGIAESIDWATSLSAMHIDHIDKEIVEKTLGVILKDWKDVRDTTDALSELFEKTGIKQKL